MKKLFLLFSILICISVTAQTGLDSLLTDLETTTKKTTENVYATFKSPRVINGHSVEMLPAGVLDTRILHRFGTTKNGFKDMFGLDYASMRIGFDYGITKDFTMGLGRSTYNKELDFFAKYRIIQQRTGEKSFPVSIVIAAGNTINTAPATTSISTSKRSAYYVQLLIARKFGENFALQLTPTYLHRNLLFAPLDENNVTALGIGTRIRLTRRTHFVVDAFPQLSGVDKNVYTTPLSIGFDIETGGHVFQLHFSNARGMNENAFLTSTNQKWGSGDFSFGFNLSRVFAVKKNKAENY